MTTTVGQDAHLAAEVLRRGGLVAFPTETVYGLGAEATNENAVRRIFRVKGRPEGHPLIVHLPSIESMEEWTPDVPPLARSLATRFWPGALTLVLRRGPRALHVVTGGLPTVALRMPDHPMTLEVLRELGGGVAAPSANRFGRVSPTSAQHVQQDLGSDVDYILDGGPCRIGIESTILDLTGEPTLLRPGVVTREELEPLTGPLRVHETGPVRAPGQHPQHYAPKARVVMIEESRVEMEAESQRSSGHRVVVVRPEPSSLYANLRMADEAGADVIVAERPAPLGVGVALLDRLTRASRKGGG